MLIVLSRLCLIALSVLMLVQAVPRYLGKAFAKDYETTLVGYSAPQDRLVLSHVRGGRWSYSDDAGQALSLEQVRKALPLAHLDYLHKAGQLPAEVAGWPLDLAQAQRHATRMRLTPRMLDRPRFDLYSLFESEPGNAGLQAPPDLFRMGPRIEFIAAADNRIDEDKSRRFDAALVAAGFVHPARMVADAPSDMKEYDNGVLLVDHQGRLFHLWQVHGQPRVVRTGTVVPADALAISVLSQSRREYQGLYVLRDRIVLLDWNDHAARPVPLPDCDFARDSFSADGDVLNWTFACLGQGRRHMVVTDRALQPLRTHHWQEGQADQDKRAFKAGVLGFLFPFTLQFERPDREQRGFHFAWSQAPWPITLAGILSALLAYVGWHRWKLRRLPRWPDLLLVAASGWAGALTLAVLGPLLPAGARPA